MRAHFDLPAGIIYLDGNSLGPPPRAALARLRETADDEWATGLIRSWNDANWIDLPNSCGAKIARLIGAAQGDVIISDSVSANLFKLAAALWKRSGGAIAYFSGEFPTDGYVLQGLSELTGAPLRLIDKNADPFADGAKVIVKSAVDYKTAAITDIAAFEDRAHRAGSSVVWDLSHATGVVDLNLTGAGARYAVGCGYKFLNGGPGAPAFLYVRNDEASTLRQPLSGWMGHAAPFDFAADYAPADGVARFACGTPAILSLSALDAALDVFERASLEALASKARALGDLFLSRAQSAGLETVSPGVGQARGGHVSLRFEHSYEVVQALIARGVIGDFRAPDLMRFGFSPSYLSYANVWDGVEALIDVLNTEEWRKPEFAVRRAVT
jgi:kynureninase